MANHVDLRFAGVTDEDLDQVVRDWDKWNATGFVPEDSTLRIMSRKFGGATSIAMMTTATLTMREVIARRDRKR